MIKFPCHKLPLRVFIICLLFVWVGFLHAEIYTWVDKKGVRHYSDVFPGRGEDIIDLQVFDTDEPPPKKTEPEKETSPAPKDTTINTSQSVLMYIEPDCEECDQARTFFKKNGIKLIEMDIASNEAAAAAFSRIGGTRVPLIVIGEIRIEGFDQAAVIRALSPD